MDMFIIGRLVQNQLVTGEDVWDAVAWTTLGVSLLICTLG